MESIVEIFCFYLFSIVQQIFPLTFTTVNHCSQWMRVYRFPVFLFATPPVKWATSPPSQQKHAQPRQPLELGCNNSQRRSQALSINKRKHFKILYPSILSGEDKHQSIEGLKYNYTTVSIVIQIYSAPLEFYIYFLLLIRN